MSSVGRLVATWMATGRDEEIERTVTEITDNQITLLDLVKALGEYLTSEEEELRTKSVDFLSSVLSRVSPERLNRQSVRVLTTFYCGKLEDFETRIPALRGLHTLARLPTCSSTDAESITIGIFAHVTMRVLLAPVRFLVFSIIDALMSRHREVFKAMGSDFVAKYISLAEGEKDPRNLLTAFAIARVILIEFDTTDYVESLFNITYCYFPITFRPPPDDIHGITTDDLRLALRSCLSASPSFGPLAIPVFLEKLMAGSPPTKRDTLQTMAACFPVYGSALAHGSARKLWSSLKLEIFHPTDPETEAEALKALQVLVGTIYAHDENAVETDDDIQGLATDVCEECLQMLLQPEKSQARPAIKVLCAFMATTPSVAQYTLSLGLPHLMKLFMNQDEVSNRPQVLLLLADFVNAAREPIDQRTGHEGGVPLLPYKDEILSIVSIGLKSRTSRLPALSLTMGLITAMGLLTDEELGFIVHIVNETFNSEKMDHDDLCDAAILSILTTVSASVPRHIQDQTLPLLLSSLPDTAPPRDGVNKRAKYWRNLLALSTLCVHPELFETLMIRLTTKLDLICVAMVGKEDVEPDAAYAHSLLKTLADTMSKKVDSGHPDVPKYIDRLVPRIFNLFIYSALQPEQNWLANDPRLLRVGADIITQVTQCLTVQRQETFIRAVFQVFSSGDVQVIMEGFHKIPSGVRLDMFGDSTNTVQKNLIALFAAGILTSRKEVRFPVASLNNFLDQILTWTLLRADNDLQRESARYLISSIVNKHTEDVGTFLEDKINNFWLHKIANADVALEERRQGLLAWSGIARALLLRNHPLSFRYTDLLFEVLGDSSIGWDAAKAIGGVASLDAVLTRKHHAIIKILYAQKFVNRIIPRITGGIKDSTKQPLEQSAYVVALTSLIKAVPKATYANELPSLIPLLLRGLEFQDPGLRADVIDTFLTAAEGDASGQKFVSEHAPTLVTYMLKNCMLVEMPASRVRIAALKYLGVLPTLVRYDVLHSSKPVVIRELGKVLDDPKKSVRKEAVDTRTIWFKYNG